MGMRSPLVLANLFHTSQLIAIIVKQFRCLPLQLLSLIQRPATKQSVSETIRIKQMPQMKRPSPKMKDFGGPLIVSLEASDISPQKAVLLRCQSQISCLALLIGNTLRALLASLRMLNVMDTAQTAWKR